MKRLYALFISCLFVLLPSGINAQIGPGGVGNASVLETWLDASNLSLSNNDPVSTWTDLSGNSNDAEQGTSAFRPIYKSNQINGLPAIEFDGTQTRLEISPSISGGDITLFMVNSVSDSKIQTIMHLDKNIIYTGSNNQGVGSRNPWSPLNRPITQNVFHIFQAEEEAGASGASRTVRVGNSSATNTRNDLYSFGATVIGCALNNEYKQFYDGSIAEIILYNTQLISAQRKIVGEYLAAKYNLTAETSLYSFSSTHGIDLKGIGQESDGSHTQARGQDSLEISNPSTLGNGDYLLVGNDNGGYAVSSDVGIGTTQRWNQTWRTDVTGTPGTVDLTFYLGSNDFASDPNDYVVLLESADGDFTNGGTSIQESGKVYDGVNKTISFSGITLSDGDYFTLAEKTPPPPTSSIDYGPGGVGNTANIATWLDASNLSLVNNDPVNIWTDLSGNSNHAEQVTSNFRATYRTNQVNGLPAIEFDGVQTRFEISPSLSGGDITLFMVNSVSSSSVQTIMHTDKNIIYTSSNTQGVGSRNPWSPLTRPITSGGYHVFNALEADGPSGALRTISVGNNSISNTRNDLYNFGATTIGCVQNSGYKQFYDGFIAEIVVFNEQLNSAKRKIVSNHLGAKYNLTPEENLYAFGSTHGIEVFGIGQESDGSHTEARGRDSLLMNSPSSLDNGDYILIGNDGADFSTNTSVPASAVERWNRTWRADVTGTPGTVDLRFYLGSNGFTSPSNYIILGETEDGDFTNGGTTIIADNPTFSISGYVEFSNVDLPDSAYFTLAEFNPSGTVQDGDWGSPSTWACNCVPGASDNAVINHVVTLNNNQSILALNIEADGSLEFNSNQTLSIYDDFTLNGSINSASGTIEALKATDEQLFYNNTVTPFEFYNLTVNTNTKLELESGTWALKNNLQVIAGGLDVVDADSMVLYSGSGGSSQILESMTSAFTGDFIVQRYISGRSTSYSNQASPVSGATVADWDDDLYLSGVNGNDPDINNGGTTFQSVFSFDSPTDSYNTITSTTTSLLPGIGYEVYLSNVNYFPADTIDYIGTPTSGSITVSVDQGWNLVGNPYHSFIDYDALSSTGLSSTYYVWNTDNGNYSALTGATNIAPGQGFWVEKNTAGTVNLTFDEDDKVNSNATTFFRNKAEPFTMNISNSANSFKHDLKIQFDAQAKSEYDNLDAKHLPSPIEEAPAIVSKASDSNHDLVINAINQWEESHLIPVNIYAGVEGEYTVKAENLNSALDNYSCVYLYDKTEDEQIDLSVDPSYTFHSEKGDHGRFELLFSNSLTSCEKLLDDNAVNQKLDHKLSLRNAYGKWYIDYTFEDLESRQLEISIYNMNGQLVSSPEHVGVSGSGNITINGIDNLNGVYLIQVKTQDEIVNKTVKL